MQALCAEIMRWDHALRSCFEMHALRPCFCAITVVAPSAATPAHRRLVERGGPDPARRAATLLQVQQSRAITSCCSRPRRRRGGPDPARLSAIPFYGRRNHEPSRVCCRLFSPAACCCHWLPTRNGTGHGPPPPRSLTIHLFSMDSKNLTRESDSLVHQVHESLRRGAGLHVRLLH